MTIFATDISRIVERRSDWCVRAKQRLCKM